MRSETPESVRLTVNVKLHGGSCAAEKRSQRIEGGGAGRERVPFESEEKIAKNNCEKFVKFPNLVTIFFRSE